MLEDIETHASETSGAGITSTETPLSLSQCTNYTITVGAGGSTGAGGKEGST